MGRILDMDPDFWPLHDVCAPYTMTSTERLYALYKSVEYILRRDIPGDFVECGVWRGGSVMMMAMSALYFGASNRKIHCFDTFEGMTAPEEVDRRDYDGQAAQVLLERETRSETSAIWAVSPLAAVQQHMQLTGYPVDNILYHQGAVEDTLPQAAPAQISLLRLDTDWYRSTSHELRHLYPPLSQGGVLIVDDYGYWRGSRQAVDEYFAGVEAPVLLNRIDETGRLAVKI